MRPMDAEERERWEAKAQTFAARINEALAEYRGTLRVQKWPIDSKGRILVTIILDPEPVDPEPIDIKADT